MKIVFSNSLVSLSASRSFCLAATAPIMKPPVPILHRCNDFLIVDKPYDLMINSDDPKETTLATLLFSQVPDLADNSTAHKFRFVHRLDFATSGCLLLALNSDAARRSYFAFNPDEVARSLRPLPFVRKYYLALLKGHLEKPETTLGIIKIDALVGQDERTPEAIERRQMVAVSKQELFSDPTSAGWFVKPKPALTKILVLEHGRYSPTGSAGSDRVEYPATKVLIRTLTGRRHQIRTHCLKEGYPIVGDYTYAGDARAGDQNTKEGTEAPPRMYLHAWKLRVAPPGKLLEDGKRLLDVTAEDPFTAEGTGGRWSSDKILTPLDDDALGVLE